MWLKPFDHSDFLRQLKLTAMDTRRKKLQDRKSFVCHEHD